MRIRHFDPVTHEEVEFRTPQEYHAFKRRRAYPSWWLAGYQKWLREKEKVMEHAILFGEEVQP